MTTLLKTHKQTDSDLNRRRFITKASGVVVATPVLLKSSLVSSAIQSGVPYVDMRSGGANRQISLFNTHTGEHLSSAYWKNGQFDDKTLSHIDYILRDHRENKIHPMSTKLIDIIYSIQQHFGNKELHIVSGYRTPKTNAMLREVSSGVARNSYHIKGMAIDLRIPGVPTKRIRNFAQTQRAGGVGWYPNSGFVHIDIGPVRFW